MPLIPQIHLLQLPFVLCSHLSLLSPFQTTPSSVQNVEASHHQSRCSSGNYPLQFFALEQSNTLRESRLNKLGSNDHCLEIPEESYNYFIPFPSHYPMCAGSKQEVSLAHILWSENCGSMRKSAKTWQTFLAFCRQ